jgi:hypothetical protein
VAGWFGSALPADPRAIRRPLWPAFLALRHAAPVRPPEVHVLSSQTMGNASNPQSRGLARASVAALQGPRASCEPASPCARPAAAAPSNGAAVWRRAPACKPGVSTLSLAVVEGRSSLAVDWCVRPPPHAPPQRRPLASCAHRCIHPEPLDNARHGPKIAVNALGRPSQTHRRLLAPPLREKRGLKAFAYRPVVEAARHGPDGSDSAYPSLSPVEREPPATGQCSCLRTSQNNTARSCPRPKPETSKRPAARRESQLKGSA